jgi:hypothetical protein
MFWRTKIKTQIILKMKNQLVLLTVFFSLLIVSSYGQKVKTKIGLKAGLNLANISNGQDNISFSPEMKADFQAGAVVNLHWGFRNELSGLGTGLWGLQPEVLYSRQGFAVDGEAVQLSYITVPVLAKYYPTKEISIEAGPYFSYLLSVSPASTVIDGAEIPLSDLKGGKDAGLAFGVGYEFAKGLNLSARYNLGISDVANNIKWKNNVIAISVGWFF